MPKIIEPKDIQEQKDEKERQFKFLDELDLFIRL